MKKAIEFLATQSILVSKDGSILNKLPNGEAGINLINLLEEITMNDDFCYTIINNRLEKIEI